MIIKVTIPTNDGEVFYFKPKDNVCLKRKYVDSLYYNESDFEHRINYDFAMFLYNRFDKIYSKDVLSLSMVEFISDPEVEEIEY